MCIIYSDVIYHTILYYTYARPAARCSGSSCRSTPVTPSSTRESCGKCVILYYNSIHNTISKE